MQVFKAYFKVMRGSATFLAISLGIFMSLAILFSSIAPKTAADKFEPTKTPIAVINRDGDSQLARGLVEYLGKTARVIPYPDDEEKLQDALFYRKVEYIAIIPPGFSDAFMAGEDASIQKVIVPDSTSSYYVDMSIDRFFNAVRLHRLYGGEEDEASLVSAAMADLASDIPVTIMSSGAGNDGSPPPESYYYQYCAYALLAMIITGVSSVMITFNEKDLYMRNLCAPLPKRSMNLQLAAGHGVFALGCWGMLVLGSFVLHSDTLLSSDLTGLYPPEYTGVCCCMYVHWFSHWQLRKEHRCTNGSDERDRPWHESPGRSIRASINHEQVCAGCCQVPAVILVPSWQTTASASFPRLLGTIYVLSSAACLSSSDSLWQYLQ